MLVTFVISLFSLLACGGSHAALSADNASEIRQDSLPFIEKIEYESVGHPVLTFDKEVHEFGTIKKGEKVSHTYKYTNTGDTALEIELISACDCTKLEYAEGKIIKPGESAEIKATFDSGHNSEDTGFIHKTIDIISNTEPIVVVVYYTATVVE